MLIDGCSSSSAVKHALRQQISHVSSTICLVCNLTAVLLSGGLSTFYPIEGEAGASARVVVMHHVHPLQAAVQRLPSAEMSREFYEHTRKGSAQQA